MTTATRFVVGHDGSPAADAALRWGLSSAAAHGRDVEVVRAWDIDLGLLLSPVPPAAEDLSAAAKQGAEAVEAAVELARAAVPEAAAVAVSTTVVQGRPGRMLAEASKRAALLVVGRRGTGAIRQLLGSTSTSVLRAARCPVAVVHHGDAVSGGRVVVGWDGSPAAERALAWAAAEAAATDRRLDVVVGWQLMTLHSAVRRDLAVVPPLSAYEELAATEAEAGAQLAVELSNGRLQRSSVDATAVHRPAAGALLESARDAALVVVGSRGRGGFAGLVLGSTSDQVARHASCPVVVVRCPDDAVEDEAGRP